MDEVKCKRRTSDELFSRLFLPISSWEHRVKGVEEKKNDLRFELCCPKKNLVTFPQIIVKETFSHPGKVREIC